MILHPIEKKDRRVTQYFGENFFWEGKPMYGPGGHIPSWQYHLGVDFSSREGGTGNIVPLPIRAGVYGKLEFFVDPGKGNMAQITGENYFIEYIHLDSFEGTNRTVYPGDIIGYTGNTGTFTTAAHLHMDVRRIVNGVVDKSGPDYGRFNFYDLLVEELPLTDSQIREKYNIPVLFRGVDIKISMEEKPGKPTVNASYDWENNYMVLYPRFFTHDEFKRKLILEHEFSHYIHVEIVHRFHKDVFEYWKELSLKSNAFVTNHARKNYFEDWAETCEEYIKRKLTNNLVPYGDDRDIKENFVVKAMRKYSRGWDY